MILFCRSTKKLSEVEEYCDHQWTVEFKMYTPNGNIEYIRCDNCGEYRKRYPSKINNTIDRKQQEKNSVRKRRRTKSSESVG